MWPTAHVGPTLSKPSPNWLIHLSNIKWPTAHWAPPFIPFPHPPPTHHLESAAPVSVHHSFEQYPWSDFDFIFLFITLPPLIVISSCIHYLKYNRADLVHPLSIHGGPFHLLMTTQVGPIQVSQVIHSTRKELMVTISSDHGPPINSN